MALSKQAVNINFAQGLDTKTDPRQVQIGKFINLENMVFDTGGLLKKRNGYTQLTTLPNDSATYIKVYNGGLIAIGDQVYSYSPTAGQWISKGNVTDLNLTAYPVVRTASSVFQTDSVVTSEGLACVVYSQELNGTPTYGYVIVDTNTQQNVVSFTSLPASASPKVRILGNYFVIVYEKTIIGVKNLVYRAIPIRNLNSPFPDVIIQAGTSLNGGMAFDCTSFQNSLYIVWNGSDVGGAIHSVILQSSLTLGTIVSYSSISASALSITTDALTSPTLFYITYIDGSTSAAKCFVINTALTQTVSPYTLSSAPSSGSWASITGYVAIAGELTAIIQSSFTISSLSTTSAALSYVLTTPQNSTIIQSATSITSSLGLASKPFSINGKYYFLTNYSSSYQPTYFVIDINNNDILKLSYSNGPQSYYQNGLTHVSVINNTAIFAYLRADLVQTINKSSISNSGTANFGSTVYTQYGVNLAEITFNGSNLQAVETAGSLFISGGYLQQFDGNILTEQGFHLYPDHMGLSATNTGSMAQQQYYYQAIYSWMDAAGNVNRSAPSIPVSITLTAGQNAVNVSIPYLNVTNKPDAIIEIYRWSLANQIFYKVTSTTAPVVNNPSGTSVTFLDTLADASIVGNEILYTTGGVVENIGAPATTVLSLYNNRLMLVNAETQEVWYSKQILQDTPVEMSDLFTLFVSSTIGSSGTTGNIKAMFPMDDKLGIFKESAIYYLIGTGPDNTGANNDFSNPVFITSTVGCSAPNSIVLIPMGLMFQSAKGIWLLDRGLGISYIGAPVEAYNNVAVTSAVNIANFNQVRFNIAKGITLAYDYYYQQWSTHNGLTFISSTIFEDLHTAVDPYGRIFQETPGVYLDGTAPVLMKFTTGWLSLAGIQAFQRLYYLLFTGQYVTPFKLLIGLAFDYNKSNLQMATVTPDSIYSTYGSSIVYGGDQTYGTFKEFTGTQDTADVFEARVFSAVQKCETFMVSAQEVFDPSQGTVPGAGLTLSAMSLLVGTKKSSRNQKAGQSF